MKQVTQHHLVLDSSFSACDKVEGMLATAVPAAPSLVCVLWSVSPYTARCLVCNLRNIDWHLSSFPRPKAAVAFLPFLPLFLLLFPLFFPVFYFVCQDTWQKFRQWGELFDFSQRVCVFGVQLLFPSSLWDLQRQPVHLPQRLLH